MAFRSHISIFGQTLHAPARVHILFIYLNYFYWRKKSSIHARPFSLWLQQSHGENVEWFIFFFCSPLLATFLSLRGLRAIKINSTFRIKLPDWNSYCARRVFPEWIFLRRIGTCSRSWPWFRLVRLVGGPVATLGDGIFHPVIYRFRIINGKKRQKIWAEELKWTLSNYSSGSAAEAVERAFANVLIILIYVKLSIRRSTANSEH